MIGTLLVFVALAFGMNKSISNYEKNKQKQKKKGKMKYMQQTKTPGK